MKYEQPEIVIIAFEGLSVILASNVSTNELTIEDPYLSENPWGES